MPAAKPNAPYASDPSADYFLLRPRGLCLPGEFVSASYVRAGFSWRAVAIFPGSVRWREQGGAFGQCLELGAEAAAGAPSTTLWSMARVRSRTFRMVT
jgi:hypothetical protein